MFREVKIEMSLINQKYYSTKLFGKKSCTENKNRLKNCSVKIKTKKKTKKKTSRALDGLNSTSTCKCQIPKAHFLILFCSVWYVRILSRAAKK